VTARQSVRSRFLYALGFDAVPERAGGGRDRESQRPGTGRLPGWSLVAVASALYASCLPPIGLGPLAFLVPFAFLLASHSVWGRPNLRVVFWWGLLQWMVTFHFIRLPHWAGWIGWPIMAGYFAIFNVLLIGVSRRLVERLGWHPVLTVPVVWTSLEWLRSVLFTGFPIGLLGHALYLQPFWIQTADIAGELTVSFLVALTGCGLGATLLPRVGSDQRSGGERTSASAVRGSGEQRPAIAGRSAMDRWLPLMALLFGGGSLVGYGAQRLGQFALESPTVDDPRIALVQGAHDVQFGLTAEVAGEQQRENYETHQRLTAQARQQNAAAVVWAESMFPAVDVLPFEPAAYQTRLDQAANDAAGQEAIVGAGTRLWPLESLLQAQRQLPLAVRETTGTGPAPVYPYAVGVPLIAGMSSFDPVADHDYNAAVLFAADGAVQTRYFKRHLVPFGEYLPLGDRFPALYQLAPMPRGLTPGRRPRVLAVAGRGLVPSICYESVIGRLIRRDLFQLNAAATGAATGATTDRATDAANNAANNTASNAANDDSVDSSEPLAWDALLNISNDGWFWGSNALDLHLASNVFRAVENRAQHLVVCNTGISAEIAPDGRILQRADKREPALLLAHVPRRPSEWRPLWWQIGNIPWGGLALVVGCALLFSLRRVK